MLRHVRLDEQRAALGIEPGGEPVEHHLEGILLHAARVGVVGGQRVPVGDEEEALVVVLQATQLRSAPT